MYSVTELKNIFRIYQYSFSALAADLGISKSYISKIINRQVKSLKYEKMITQKVQEMQKTAPLNVNKKRVYKRLARNPFNTKDVPLRNGIQTVLDQKKMTITRLAQGINEARSSVSQVLIGVRQTARIRKKIIDYLKLDEDVFFRRTWDDIKKLQDGILVPLPTKTETRERVKAQQAALEELKACLTIK